MFFSNMSMGLRISVWNVGVFACLFPPCEGMLTRIPFNSQNVISLGNKLLSDVTLNISDLIKNLLHWCKTLLSMLMWTDLFSSNIDSNYSCRCMRQLCISCNSMLIPCKQHYSVDFFNCPWIISLSQHFTFYTLYSWI